MHVTLLDVDGLAPYPDAFCAAARTIRRLKLLKYVVIILAAAHLLYEYVQQEAFTHALDTVH